MNVLLMGPLPPPVGGATVLFQQLVEDLSKEGGCHLRVINTSRTRVGGLSNAMHAVRCVCLLIRHLPWASVVSFQTSRNGVIIFGPIVHILSRLFGRKWILRGFGGSLDVWHRTSASLLKWLFDRTVLQADALLLERKASVEYFQKQSHSVVHWYPNSRHRPDHVEGASTSRPGHRRFVFVGHVKPSKGIAILLDASKIIRRGMFTVDVYGPLQDGVTPEWFVNSPVNYRGPLASDRVINTLAGYDALILPTYYAGEGYPGVILEAYCAGIPVISTRCGGIPEIVTPDTGILLEPRDVGGLAAAMQELIDSDQRLLALREGARAKADEFDADRWAHTFVALCRTLATQEGT